MAWSSLTCPWGTTTTLALVTSMALSAGTVCEVRAQVGGREWR